MVGEYEGKQFWNAIDGPVNTFYANTLNNDVMDDLRRIWLWPPESGIDYAYPDKRGWFDLPANRTKRIADTIDA